MNTFEVALKTGNLPDKIEELVPMMFAGQAAVKFMSAKLKIVSDKNLSDPMGILDKQRKQTVEDGQCMGEMLLRIMSRIGEISETVPQERANQYMQMVGKKAPPTKHEKLGLASKTQLRQAQFIKNHPDLVDETIKECKKNEDIPNITTVFNKHKHAREMEKEKARYDKAVSEGRTEKMAIQLRLEETLYLNKLKEIIGILPKDPPKDWTKEGMAQAKALSNLIIKRLEVFHE
jgi:hypothetical protein